MSKFVNTDSLRISDGDDFREALRVLLVEAEDNGVDVRGGWSVSRNSKTTPAWDLEITALSRQTTYEAPEGDDFPLEAVLSAVAEREGVEREDLPPLQDSVDVDSLEHVLNELTDEVPGEVSFEYCGYTVSIRADGTIVIDG